MNANTRHTDEVLRNYCDQTTVSHGLQDKFEGLLAGYSLVHPLEVLEVFPQVEQIMQNQIALDWIRYLSDRERYLLTLEGDDRTKFITQLIIGFDGGQHRNILFRWMNDTYYTYEPVFIEDDRIMWRGYAAEIISTDLVQRIISQHYLRDGLHDLAEYVLEVLER